MFGLGEAVVIGYDLSNEYAHHVKAGLFLGIAAVNTHNF